MNVESRRFSRKAPAERPAAAPEALIGSLMALSTSLPCGIVKLPRRGPASESMQRPNSTPPLLQHRWTHGSGLPLSTSGWRVAEGKDPECVAGLGQGPRTLPLDR